MTSMRVCVVLSVLALSSVLAAQSSPSPEALLKAAINREVVEGDFPAAMEQYQTIAAKYATNRPVASKALLHLGTLQERLGRPEARATYQRVLSEYGDSGATAAAARTRLSAIQQASAGPFRERSLDAFLPDGDATAPVGSPDGKFIAYRGATVGKTPGTGRAHVLLVRDLADGRERVVVESKEPGAAIQEPTWSPDSQRIAFVLRSKTPTFTVQIVTVGDRRVRAASHACLAIPQVKWSPNGQYIVFGCRSTAGLQRPLDVELMTVSTGLSRVVGASTPSWSGVVWSADNAKFAYVGVAGDGRGNAIQLSSVDGSAPGTLPLPAPGSDTGAPTMARWTADDRILVTQRSGDATESFSIPTSGGQLRKICEGRVGGNDCLGFSPDGQWQVTRDNLAGGGRIVLRHTLDGKERPLTPGAVSEQPVAGFSLDGRLFAFRSNRDGAEAVYVVPVDRLPVATPVKLSELSGPGVSGWWTRTGLVLRLSTRQMNLYRIETDPSTGRPTGETVRLTEGSHYNEQAFVSPNAKQVAYLARNKTTGAIGFALMEANGTNEHVIREVPATMSGRITLLGWHSMDELVYADAGPSVSPTTPMSRATKALVFLNTQTGELRRGPTGLVGNLILAPGSGEVFTSSPGSSPKAISLRTAATRDLVNPWAGDWSLPTVSTDARFVAYLRDEMTAGRPQPSGEIHVRSLESGLDKIVAKFGSGAVVLLHGFSPEGRHLLFRILPSRALVVVNTETGESWPLVEDSSTSTFVGARWSTDGTFVVLEGGTGSASWQAFEGATYDAVTKIIAGRK